MTRGAFRSRLVELRRTLDDARRGREVLERKRELLLRELRRRAAAVTEERRRLAGALAAARHLLADARVELGGPSLDAAILAQPETAAVDARPAMLLGVPLTRLSARPATFTPRYGATTTAVSLGDAGAAFTALVPELARLADDQAALAAVRRGLWKTARRLSALDKAVIPRLAREVREVGAALEEEERDEALRRKRWLEGRATAPPPPAR